MFFLITYLYGELFSVVEWCAAPLHINTRLFLSHQIYSSFLQALRVWIAICASRMNKLFTYHSIRIEIAIIDSSLSVCAESTRLCCVGFFTMRSEGTLSCIIQPYFMPIQTLTARTPHHHSLRVQNWSSSNAGCLQHGCRGVRERDFRHVGNCWMF